MILDNCSNYNNSDSTDCNLLLLQIFPSKNVINKIKKNQNINNNNNNNNQYNN